jgi:hypothetical protein
VTSVRSDGRTAVTVYAVPTGPGVPVTVTTAGATSVIVTAAVDGVLASSAVSRGRTSVTAAAAGLLAVSAASAGETTVTVACAMKWVVSARADGVTNAFIIYTPDLFGDPGTEGVYNPGGLVPDVVAPPIRLGMKLRGACSVIPPDLP